MPFRFQHPKSRRWRWTAAALALGAAVAAQAAGISDGVVKIGVLTDFSSVSSANAGQGSVVAAQLAIEDFSKDAKVLGKTIELVSADSQGKTDIGAALARKWFDVDHVDMITDLTFSNVALAVDQIAKEKDKVALVTGAGSSAITGDQCNANTIHWMYDTSALARGTATELMGREFKTWYFITADYAFGHALEKDATAIVEAQGGKVLGSVRHPVNSSDMSSYVLQAQSSGAQVIGLANSGLDTLNTVKQAREFGIGEGSNTQVIAPLLSLITEVHGMGLQNAKGMFITTGFYWNQDERTRAFSKRYFARMKKEPSMMQAAVYSAVLHYLQAVQATGTDDAKPVIAKLKSEPIDDAIIRNGHIRADGLLTHDMLLVRVKTPAESKGPWDLYEIEKVIPGEQAFTPLAKSTCPLLKH